MATPSVPADQEQAHQLASLRRAVLAEYDAIYRLVWAQCERYATDSEPRAALREVLHALRARRRDVLRQTRPARPPK